MSTTDRETELELYDIPDDIILYCILPHLEYK